MKRLYKREAAWQVTPKLPATSFSHIVVYTPFHMTGRYNSTKRSKCLGFLSYVTASLQYTTLLLARFLQYLMDVQLGDCTEEVGAPLSLVSRVWTLV